MDLSYSSRVTCLAMFTCGSFALMLELAMLGVAPIVARLLAPPLSIRVQERLLFLLALLPFSVAVFLTLFFVLPRYLQAEDNLAAEHVGILCVAGAVFMGVRSAWVVARSTLRLYRTWLWRKGGHEISLDPDLGIPA